ncbi:MAG: Crp/Fnr family transcriptional regulator [Chloroflexota bacterium]
MSPKRPADTASARRVAPAGLLAGAPYLASPEAPLLEEIARSAVRRRFEPGQVVFIEGEPAAGLCFVESGWLKSVKVSPAGREQVLRVVGPGEVFNEVGVFVGTANPVTVVALEEATLWIIERQTMLRLVDQRPELARLVIQNLAERALYLVALVEDLSLRTVEARLARLILQRSREGTLERKRWATQAEMASRLGTVPDVLQRALRNLVDEGLIEVERQRIRILNRKGLKAKAQLEA